MCGNDDIDVDVVGVVVGGVFRLLVVVVDVAAALDGIGDVRLIVIVDVVVLGGVVVIDGVILINVDLVAVVGCLLLVVGCCSNRRCC